MPSIILILFHFLLLSDTPDNVRGYKWQARGTSTNQFSGFVLEVNRSSCSQSSPYFPYHKEEKTALSMENSKLLSFIFRPSHNSLYNQTLVRQSSRLSLLSNIIKDLVGCRLSGILYCNFGQTF